MSEKKTEAQLRSAWITRARTMTVADLPAFVEELAEHPHDYGSICVAMGAAAVAACYALNNSPRGGITGFQGGAVGWEFLRGWHQWPDDNVGHRLLDLEHLLYPQYERHFNSISAETFERLRKRAAVEIGRNGENMHRDVLTHMQKIMDGIVPFGLRIER